MLNTVDEANEYYSRRARRMSQELQSMTDSFRNLSNWNKFALTDTGENASKCAVFFRPGAESYSSFECVIIFCAEEK